VETVSTFTFPGRLPNPFPAFPAAGYSCQKACWLNGALALPATQKAHDKLGNVGKVFHPTFLAAVAPTPISPGSQLGKLFFHLENFKTKRKPYN